MQMHFSYINFYLTAISNLTNYFSICLGLIHFIKSYNYWINSIMTVITMKYLNQPIYYNAIVKLAVLMLLKGILFGLALISLKGIHHWSS